MYQESIIDMLMRKMIHFNQNDPQRIHHLIKVHSFAQMIGRMEQLDGHSQFLTECAALVHDIGIRPAEEKYGMSSGRLQEQEGPFYARKMLGELGFEEADINRICYLVGHHHTYADIDGIDYHYGQFDILDTTEYMENTLLVWKKLMFSFDAICTGFIVSERQSSLVYEYCKEQQKSGTSIFVDPIMGDDGKRYNGVTNQVVAYMKRLCSIADVIVPNITEACFLSEYTVKHTYSEPEIEVIANRLHTLGAKSVVITSANINGRMFTVVKSSPKNSCILLPYEEIPVRFPGTGDIFMAIVVGHYLKSGQILESVQSAMRQLEKIIYANLHDTYKYK